MKDSPSIAEAVLQKQTADSAAREVGALPWRIGVDRSLEILLITSRQRDRWTLPKGLPAEERTAVRSAALRAFEQVGIIGRTHPVAVGGYSYVRSRANGASRQGHVTVFSLHVKGTLISWPERKHVKRRWFGVGEAAQLVAEPELAGLLEQFNPQATGSIA